jgi:hypothetical protein
MFPSLSTYARSGGHHGGDAAMRVDAATPRNETVSEGHVSRMPVTNRDGTTRTSGLTRRAGGRQGDPSYPVPCTWQSDPSAGQVVGVQKS